MTPAETIQQIRDVISTLMIGGMIDHQHYPVAKRVGTFTQIGIEGSPDLSITLRDVRYEEAFTGLHSAGAYHMRLIDGALVQLMYCFERKQLSSHRLAYFPSPLLESYDEAAQTYQDDEIFSDIFSSVTVRAPLRFDYSASDDEHVDVDHPKSHFTIGQYKGCRIPVNGPMTPFRFMRFILRNFYNSAYSSVSLDQRAAKSSFPDSITKLERDIFHVIS